MSAPLTRLQAYDLLDRAPLSLVQVAIMRAYIACQPSALPVDQGESWPGLKHLCEAARASRGKVQAERRLLFQAGVLLKRPQPRGAPLRCTVDLDADRLQRVAQLRTERQTLPRRGTPATAADPCHGATEEAGPVAGGMPQDGRGAATRWQGGMPRRGTEPAPYNPLQEPITHRARSRGPEGATPPAPVGATPAADAAGVLMETLEQLTALTTTLRAELEAEREARRRLEAQLGSLQAALEALTAQPKAQAQPEAAHEAQAHVEAPAGPVDAAPAPEALEVVEAPARPVLTLVAGGQTLPARSRPQRPPRAEVEAAVVACAETVLGRLDGRRRAVFGMGGAPRAAFAQASVAAMAKALLRLDSRQSGLSAAVTAAEALAARADLAQELVARGHEIDLVHAFMLRSPSNRRWMATSPQYPQPIGQAPDFVVILREVDRNLEAAQAWDAAGRPLGHDSASLEAWTSYLSARRRVPVSASPDVRKQARTEWAKAAPTPEGVEQRQRVARAFATAAGVAFDPFTPTAAQEAAFVAAWFDDEAATSAQAAR